MSAVARHVCPVGPRIVIWDTTDDGTRPVCVVAQGATVRSSPDGLMTRISPDGLAVRVGGPVPDSTAMPAMTAPVVMISNRHERRAAAARRRARP